LIKKSKSNWEVNFVKRVLLFDALFFFQEHLVMSVADPEIINIHIKVQSCSFVEISSDEPLSKKAKKKIPATTKAMKDGNIQNVFQLAIAS
jgi:hypothetical protein